MFEIEKGNLKRKRKLKLRLRAKLLRVAQHSSGKARLGSLAQYLKARLKGYSRRVILSYHLGPQTTVRPRRNKLKKNQRKMLSMRQARL